MKNEIAQKTVEGRSIALRRPQITDSEFIADYWFGPASSILHSFVHIELLGDRETFLARTRHLIDKLSLIGPWPMLIGEVDGKPCGSVLINGEVPNKEALVHVHIWDPDLRRTGIATAFAKDVFRYFIDAYSLERLIMQVPLENVPVIKLLESLDVKSAGVFFGKAAPICKDGEYSRFVINAEQTA